MDQYLAQVHDKDNPFWERFTPDASSGLQDDTAVGKSRDKEMERPVTNKSDLMAPSDVVEYMQKISKPTANAKIGGGDQEYEKYVVLNKDESGTLLLNAAGVYKQGGNIDYKGNIAVAHWHWSGLNQLPHGADDGLAKVGVYSFVSGADGRSLWEVGRMGGATSIRMISPRAQDWEPFQPFPENYSPGEWKYNFYKGAAP